MAKDEANRIAELIRESIVDSLVAQNPIPLATGRLASSIEVKPTDNGFEIYAEDYWKFVEFGRKGHGKFPPILPIKEWIKAKGLKPKNPNMSPTQFAWAIATNLKVSSIKPRPFLEDGLANVGDEVLEVAGDLVSELIDDVFDEKITRREFLKKIGFPLK